MKRFTVISIAVGAILAVVLGLGPTLTPDPADLDSTQREIDFFSGRLEAHPADVISATRLGTAYRQRQRETTDISYLYRAEEVLRRGLQQLPGYAPTELALARVLIDLHRFDEGLALAWSSHETDPQPEAKLAIGDAHLAMGEYDQASEAFAEVATPNSSPTTKARLARIAELRGDLQTAAKLMEQARAEVAAASAIGESTAWFSTRLADLYVSLGLIRDGENQLRLALTALPDYAPAIAGLGDVAMAEGDLTAAIEHFERASQLATDPAWLFALADLHSLLGNEDAARDYLDAALGTIDEFGSIHPRDFALYYARSSRPDEAIEFATRALKQSRDIYAHDTMAFALHSAGRHEEAWVHMDQALALGTVEPLFDFHAGAMQIELGNWDTARTHLERALATGLDPWDQEVAEELLNDLD